MTRYTVIRLTDDKGKDYYYDYFFYYKTINESYEIINEYENNDIEENGFASKYIVKQI